MKNVNCEECKIYTVKFNTGAGDEDFSTLDEAIDYAEKECTYTQCNIDIEENGTIIMSRKWCGCLSGIEEMENPIQFGSFGFYADWADID